MTRPRLLDLFCKAGGAAMGYYRAGFDVVGVDIEPQPRYPFTFVQGDALEYVSAHGHEFDAIHASPPCQAYSLGAIWRGTSSNHPDLVGATREALMRTGKPFVIENVPGAPISKTVMLCGTMFDLGVIRHRHFEVYPEILFLTPTCAHVGKVSDGRYATVAGHGGDGSNSAKVWAKAMGIDWMRKEELAEAIPPMYTEYIGGYLLDAVTEWRKVYA